MVAKDVCFKTIIDRRPSKTGQPLMKFVPMVPQLQLCLLNLLSRHTARHMIGSFEQRINQILGGVETAQKSLILESIVEKLLDNNGFCNAKVLKSCVLFDQAAIN